MEIPKTFRPEGDLKEKLEQLLKGPGPKQTLEEREQTYREAKEEFPEFIEYFSKLYPDLEIIKDVRKETHWSFWSKDWGIMGMVGMVETYHKPCGKGLTKYGYRGEVCVNKKWIYLEYRKGYICPNGSNDVIITHNPHRYDDEDYNIPFP